jgi:maltose-binding protein MalE
METSGKENLRFLSAVADSADYTVSYPRIAAWLRIDEVIESRLSEVVAKMTTPEQALKTMQAEITAIVKDEGLLK